MKKNFSALTALISLLFIFSAGITLAEETKNGQWTTGEIRLKHEYQHFFLPKAQNYIYEIVEEKQGDQKEFCIDTEDNNSHEEKIQELEIKKSVNTEKIKAYLAENIAPKIDMVAKNVTISKDENGKIIFDGYAQVGKELNLDISAELIAQAIKNNIDIVTLQVENIDPIVEVKDEELKKKGILEVVSIGRSDFYPSSKKRIQNIMAGADRFNGYIIKKGEEFSFNTRLGRVDGSTGYAKEYVILGPKVVKEYGGGLCQVSSTAYRGIMIAGLEVTERYNHSFAVNHYKPYGSDATIYQGVKDFKWINDSPSDILIQTRRGGHRNSELFFIYYGTKSQRDVKIFGPSFKNFRTPPKNKVTYSESIPAGSRQHVSGRVRGFDSTFGRQVLASGTEIINDTFLSPYQARGNWTIIGGTEPSHNVSSDEVERGEDKNI